MWCKFVLVTSLLAAVVYAQQCDNKETCGACLQTAGCAWCAQPSQGDTTAVRCRIASENRDWCQRFLINPQPDARIEQDDELNEGQGEPNTPGYRPTVQIKPQRIRVKARPGVPITLQVKYSQATDYPVDLYYLMDLSQSMNDDKKQLSKLGKDLAVAMQQLTSNFRLGFGSFVDKREMPFVNTVKEKLERPCSYCTSPYSFRNHMPLSTNVDEFGRKVNDTPISGNIDSPEGGFDALMQAMVCTKDIGWREKARHLIVFSTDADYHYAGDGKLAGIVEPNDEKCHMKNSEYTHGLLQDYPSVAQINSKAKDRNMNIIFAVTDYVKTIYEALSQRVEGASYGILSGDSSNVVKFVKDQYEKLTDGVTLIDDANSNFNIRYFSTCRDGGGHRRETRTCDGLRKGLQITFDVEITALACPKDKRKWMQTIEIKPQAINEKLSIDFEIDCECSCERKGNPGFEGNSRQCTGSGDSQCGVCVCKEGFVGRACECSTSAGFNQEDDQQLCRPGNSTAEVCNKRGLCKCGKCLCHPRNDPKERIWGKYCECDNYSTCRKNRLGVCSGADHGECDCGTCICKPGWKGELCSCSTSEDTCKAPGSQDVCSGHGDCSCGQCVCREDNNGKRYNGRYCEECPDCTGQCSDLRMCVELMVYLNDTQKAEEIGCNNFFKLHIVPDLEVATIAEALKMDPMSPHNAGSYSSATASASSSTFEQRRRKRELDGDFEPSGDVTEFAPDNGILGTTERQCSQADQVGCTFFFSYVHDNNGVLHVFAMENKECSKEVNIFWVVVGVIGSILVAGFVLLLIWKLATTLHDRREFARFENERQNAKWDAGDNPLYVGATSTFSNPTFGGGGGNRQSQLPN